MAGYEDEALQIQLAVFEEHQCTDETQAPQISHQQLLDKLRAKVKCFLFRFLGPRPCELYSFTCLLLLFVLVVVFKISNTLYDSYLRNILLRMSEMDYGDAKV